MRRRESWSSSDIYYVAGILTVLGLVVGILLKSVVAVVVTIGLAIALDVVIGWLLEGYDTWGDGL